jgi:transcriptional regulator with XRE-family HTH domain
MGNFSRGEFTNRGLYMYEISARIADMTSENQPVDPAERISYLLWSQKKKQKVLAEALGYSSGFISDVVNGKKELGWKDTAIVADVLNTTVDYLLGRRDDPAPYTGAGPVFEHEESLELAKLVEQQPDWLRRQILAVVHAQIDSIKEGTTAAQDEQQLRETLRTLVLVLGKDEVNRLIQDAGRQLQPVRVGVGSYRQVPLGKL